MRWTAIVLWLWIAVLSPLGAADPELRVHHDWSVAIEPSSSQVTVRGSFTLPPEQAGAAPFEFVLNSALTVVPSRFVETVGEEQAASGSLESVSAAKVRRYRITEIPENRRIPLEYSGSLAFGLSDEEQEYTRGFRETIGHVGEEGVYLAAASVWYPYFDGGLLTYTIDVRQPDGWHVVSAGRGTSRGADGAGRWESEGPTEEIYLTGGPLVKYEEAAGAIDALVYLREDDPALARKYLTTTAQYVEMYRELIGPYPYSKFALVENFWETGYGMPSFTLLGPRVIRFPFILHSSYPHEILHNWWGNGVFVDYDSGNWCEGLTAYLADHLVQEQRGRGEAYRRDTLQKYRNYVDGGRDFPLQEFRSRHSAATEAVGYGKSLMGFHMLRLRVGDDAFREALAGFYRANSGKRASFRDIQAAFESVTEGEELRSFFDPWLARTGAPSLAVQAEVVADDDDGFRIKGTLEQIQPEDPFVFDVSIVVDTEDGPEPQTIRVDRRSTPFALTTVASPVLLRVDPGFDLFRMLDPREMPPSIGQLFGEPEILAVLPAAAPETLREAYRDLAEGWQSVSHTVVVALDSQLESVPDDRSVWLFGKENRFAGPMFEAGEPRGLSVTPREIGFAGASAPVAGHSWVVVRRHPSDVDRAVGLIVVDPPAAFEGIARKLPHYGKYSYLAFAGAEPDNVVKGQWSTDDSPLVVDLRPVSARDTVPALTATAPRAALAELPPVFSQNALAGHVTELASPAYEGRGVGTAGLDRAAEYIAARFAALGLTPAGDDDGSYLQSFVVEAGPDGNPQRVSNVIGYLPGTRDSWRGQSVVLSAHYDHLGSGWPDVHSGNEGALHPGADDNASGVAVLLELAAIYAQGEAPDRTLVFAAFTAEEAGRLGSRYFVEHPDPFPLEQMRSVVNLDTVGRLGDGPLQVLATGTADEWPHIFRGVGFVTGIESRQVPEALESSDQTSFIDEGIPAVQVFTGAHDDYHRPGDTVNKVDAAGLVRVATFVKETVDYLVQREDPLSVTITGATRHATGRSGDRAGSGRRVSFGTVPEFGFPGPGVEVASLVPDSPAARAGIEPGDVLTHIDDRPVADLRGFSVILKGLEPGQTVRARVTREGESRTLEVTVEAR